MRNFRHQGTGWRLRNSCPKCTPERTNNNATSSNGNTVILLHNNCTAYTCRTWKSCRSNCARKGHFSGKAMHCGPSTTHDRRQANGCLRLKQSLCLVVRPTNIISHSPPQNPSSCTASSAFRCFTNVFLWKQEITILAVLDSGYPRIEFVALCCARILRTLLSRKPGVFGPQ